MPAVPGIPDCDCFPAVSPGQAKPVKGMLVVHQQSIASHVRVFHTMIFDPGFEHGFGLLITHYDDVERLGSANVENGHQCRVAP